MTIGEKVRSIVRNWLKIEPAPPQGITIREPLSREAGTLVHKVWYRGEASELDQLYKQLAGDPAAATMFWAAAPAGEPIRKIHSGLPGILVDTLAGMVKADLAGPDFGNDSAAKAKWDEVAEEIDLPELVEQAVAGALVIGDGAFKISADPAVSNCPIVEFWPGDRVEYQSRHGRVCQVDFWSNYREGNTEYRLRESYGRGFLRYALFDGEKEVPLDRVPALRGLAPVSWEGESLLAVPFRVWDGGAPGRGRSVYQGKTGDFDALDEVISQWWDAVRAGRTIQYIPESLIPRDPNTGALDQPCPFGQRWVSTAMSNKEGTVDRIETHQAAIPSSDYLAAYTTALDLCLQGIVSPATLGIDVGKMSSADAQREKKDITGATRNAITGALEKVLPKLISAILMVNDSMKGDAPGQYSPSVTFGEYGAPDFDSRVETLVKASAGGVMSVEALTEELWGSSKDKKWVEEEVARLKAEKGLSQEPEPSLGADLP